MHNDFHVETVVSKTKVVQITAFGEKVSAVKIYFAQGSSITISTAMHQAIQNDTGRKYLKGLKAKLTLLTSSPNPLMPYKIQIGCICGFGLPLEKLKDMGMFEKVRR